MNKLKLIAASGAAALAGLFAISTTNAFEFAAYNNSSPLPLHFAFNQGYESGAIYQWSQAGSPMSTSGADTKPQIDWNGTQSPWTVTNGDGYTCYWYYDPSGNFSGDLFY